MKQSRKAIQHTWRESTKTWRYPNRVDKSNGWFTQTAQTQQKKKISQDQQTGVICPIIKKTELTPLQLQRIIFREYSTKMYARVLEVSLRKRVKETRKDTQSVFRKRRGMQDKTLILRQLIGKTAKTRMKIHPCFIDMSVWQNKRVSLWKIPKAKGINSNPFESLKSLYSRAIHYFSEKN